MMLNLNNWVTQETVNRDILMERHKNSSLKDLQHLVNDLGAKHLHMVVNIQGLHLSLLRDLDQT